MKKHHPYNPSHAVGTCATCGGEMVYNVPRLGPDGGYVHKATGMIVCGPRQEIHVQWDAANSKARSAGKAEA